MFTVVVLTVTTIRYVTLPEIVNLYVTFYGGACVHVGPTGTIKKTATGTFQDLRRPWGASRVPWVQPWVVGPAYVACAWSWLRVHCSRALARSRIAPR